MKLIQILKSSLIQIIFGNNFLQKTKIFDKIQNFRNKNEIFGNIRNFCKCPRFYPTSEISAKLRDFQKNLTLLRKNDIFVKNRYLRKKVKIFVKIRDFGEHRRCSRNPRFMKIQDLKILENLRFSQSLDGIQISFTP